MLNKKEPQLFEVKETLGPLESEVMEIVWSSKKTDVRGVTETILRKKPIAYTTVMTIMNTLFKKGFLKRRKVGKAYQYKTVAPKAVFLKNALSLVMIDLTKTYGLIQVLLAMFRFNTLLDKQLRVPIKQVWFWRNKTPVGYGMTFMLLATIFLYSVWDLFQNLQFFGTMEYINLAFSEPALAIDRLNLVTLAIAESLPIMNISATAIFFALFVFVGKKLNKITNRNIFPKLGGLS